MAWLNGYEWYGWNGTVVTKGGTVVDDIKILAKVASCMFILCSFWSLVRKL